MARAQVDAPAACARERGPVGEQCPARGPARSAKLRAGRMPGKRPCSLCNDVARPSAQKEREIDDMDGIDESPTGKVDLRPDAFISKRQDMNFEIGELETEG